MPRLDRGVWGKGVLMRSFFKAISIVAAVQLFTAVSAFGFHLDPPLDLEPPFVICENQQYALCAAASCFVYNGLAYCKCDILKGDSISLQLSYSSPAGERNVCDVNQQGKKNGYMVSTFSLPNDVKKGGRAAVYTCPGSADAGSGVIAPEPMANVMVVFASRALGAKRFPGFAGRVRNKEIICSCPISTGATPGSSDSFG